MINFRFHLVSLVAVFLAVGLGILVGSTVVDQRIVNRLDTEINSVRKENSQRKKDAKQLSDQNSQEQGFIALAAPFVVDARLDGESVAIVAERGVDSGVLKQTETLLRDAGADVPGVLWLNDSWQLDTSQRTQHLATALGLHGNAVTMRDRALDMLAVRLSAAPQRTRSTARSARSTSTSTSTSAPAKAKGVDTLTALEDAGFVSVSDGDASEFDTFPAHAAHVLVVTGDDSHFVGTDVTSSFARSLTRADLPTVVAAVYDGGSDGASAPKRGATLAPIIDDQVLSSSISTVDDLELVQGQVAAVLTLEVVGNGTNGHYGYGSGASAPLPPHSS